jgi:two-component system chemotaxis response regulator CheB
MNPVRVLVVDDSALMRKLIPSILKRDPAIEVVGTALDGEFALKKIEEVKPNVVTLDLEMPRMDGLETLRQITRRFELPVVIVSAHSRKGASATFKALSLGAFDFVAKPQDAASAQLDSIATELIAKIKAAAHCPVKRQQPAEAVAVTKKSPKQKPRARTVVAIGVSTGGPNALQQALSKLPADFPAAIVIVQHMPQGFTAPFAKRLDECCAIDVKEAESGDLLLGGRALIAPGDRHLKIRRMPLGHVVVISDDEPVGGHRPSVDVLFRSLAKEVGSSGIAVLMTGMGDDGADAMGAVKEAGGLTLAQDEESCVVFGMPRAAIQRGHVMKVVDLDKLATILQQHCAVEKAVAVGEKTR